MTKWIELRAGPLEMGFDPEWASLRRIRLGAIEVLRGIYAPIRDEHWGTVRPAVSNLEVEKHDDSFRLSFDAECKRGEIDFAWHGTIAGEADGTVCFTFKGAARSTFLRQRIGLCILHPIAECAGRPCTVEHVDGSVEEGRFPRLISPHQPFRDIRAIRHEVAPGLQADVRCEGDTFEMEDQRNWTDGSFKTYCTPLDLPRPVEVAAGTVIEQSVTLTLKGHAPAMPKREGRVTLTMGERPTGQLPRIGLAAASHGQALGLREVARLKALSLSHLRVDLRPSEPSWNKAFSRATREAGELSAALEVALFLSEAAEEELRFVGEELRRLQPKVAAWLLFAAAGTPKPFGLARRFLATDDRATRFGGGSAANFTELNRSRPDIADIDLACYAMNPQVHTFDDASMVETLEGQEWTVRTARDFLGGIPVAATPVTLKPRQRPPEGGTPNADPRQASLFCAAWMLGSLTALAEAGLYSVTYYETTGALGVMADDGAVFPVYHVLADVGEFALGEVIPVATSDPVVARGLAVRKRGKARVVLANLTDQAQRVRVCGLSGFLSLHPLDASSLVNATRAPEAFRAKPGRMLNAAAAGFDLDLPPYGLVRIDGAR